MMYQLTYTNSRDDNTILPLVIPASSTSVRLHELFAKLSNWETMLGSHCSMCNADGAVYQTRQELIRASELIVVQLKVAQNYSYMASPEKFQTLAMTQPLMITILKQSAFTRHS